MHNTRKKILKLLFLLILGITLSCSDDKYEIEYASGYPDKMAGNWVVFQFYEGTLDGQIAGPYDLVTALDPNSANTLIIDNIYNTGVRIKAEIRGDTGFYAQKTEQLEKINQESIGVELVSIEGYINDNPVLVNFIYRLASSAYENIAFSESDISEIVFFRAGLYDENDSPYDTIMIMGYRKTGFEDVDYNR
jgi:hypothetical protein